jgi:hypothetical protein
MNNTILQRIKEYGCPLYFVQLHAPRIQKIYMKEKKKEKAFLFYLD